MADSGQDNSPDQTTEFDDMSFEQVLTLLDETVAALESGSLTLAQSMESYERGMKLARACNQKLSSAEIRITRISADYGDTE